MEAWVGVVLRVCCRAVVLLLFWSLGGGGCGGFGAAVQDGGGGCERGMGIGGEVVGGDACGGCAVDGGESGDRNLRGGWRAVVCAPEFVIVVCFYCRWVGTGRHRQASPNWWGRSFDARAAYSLPLTTGPLSSRRAPELSQLD